MDIIIGTAGHIDHGKTALVKALTGIDADRLPEEKKRGITIDLGFAELDLGEVRIGFVDVPGHERFVKNMLAGAHGLDMVALVIAADEGVMPQTREHFDICRLLETKTGLIVLTKVDLVDEELLEIVRLDAEELVKNSFLQDAPMIAVSARTGIGIQELKSSLKSLALAIPSRQNDAVVRLPIDRSFSVKGFGAVVTGTLMSGEIVSGTEMELLPSGKKARVRGLQTHGKTVETARAGQRTAVNLGGVDNSEIERGNVLTTINTLRPTQIFDAEIEVLPDARKALRSRSRVRVHLGTSETLARVQVLEESGAIAPGEKGFAQFRLETSVITIPGERFIVRSYSPQMTIAGGQILDGLAAKHRRRDFENVRNNLEKLRGGDRELRLRTILDNAAEFGLSFKDLQARTGWIDSILRDTLSLLVNRKSVIDSDGIYLSRTSFENLATRTVRAVQTHHRREPLARGMMRETLREKVFAKLPSEIFRRTLQMLVERNEVIAEKEIVRVASHSRNLSANDTRILERLQRIYDESNLSVPNLDTALSDAVVGSKSTKNEARKIFQLLLDSGELVKVSNDYYFSQKSITELIEKLAAFAARSSDRLIDVASFKDLAGVSRKHAIPLLEYLDLQKITRRAGDKRLIV